MNEDSMVMFIPITFFVSIAACVALNFYFRYRTRVSLHDTVRAALDKGQALSADIVRQLGEQSHPALNDRRRGVISVAIALAVAVFALSLGDADALRPLLGLAAFPLLVGLAYLLLAYVARAERRHEPAL